MKHRSLIILSTTMLLFVSSCGTNDLSSTINGENIQFSTNAYLGGTEIIIDSKDSKLLSSVLSNLEWNKFDDDSLKYESKAYFVLKDDVSNKTFNINVESGYIYKFESDNVYSKLSKDKHSELKNVVSKYDIDRNKEYKLSDFDEFSWVRGLNKSDLIRVSAGEVSVDMNYVNCFNYSSEEHKTKFYNYLDTSLKEVYKVEATGQGGANRALYYITNATQHKLYINSLDSINIGNRYYKFVSPFENLASSEDNSIRFVKDTYKTYVNNNLVGEFSDLSTYEFTRTDKNKIEGKSIGYFVISTLKYEVYEGGYFKEETKDNVFKLKNDKLFGGLN